MSLTRQEWERRARELRIETRAFIDGHYRAAEEGDTFDCLSPIDGRSLGQVASCGPADADLAVQVARERFESGVWSRLAPVKRKQVMIRFAERLDAHREELALLESLDMGKPITDALKVDIPAAARALNLRRRTRPPIFPSRSS